MKYLIVGLICATAIVGCSTKQGFSRPASDWSHINKNERMFELDRVNCRSVSILGKNWTFRSDNSTTYFSNDRRLDETQTEEFARVMTENEIELERTELFNICMMDNGWVLVDKRSWF